ncbi:TPA: hypothetical protein QDZ42_002421 [Stenotrophomonas maltophilia]|nr:hypothetical protein [Stenotrophomonas maltophilia]HDS1043755.1 hypothetical protein [Stenotrophomonas maltophilia]
MNSNAQITPEELGHRMLELIESTDNFDQLTATSIRSAVGSQFDSDANDESGFYTLMMPGGDWQYSVTYNFDISRPQYSNVAIELIRSKEVADSNSPPCELDLSTYRSSLTAMGFKAEPVSYNEIGWAAAFNYTRNNVRAQIIPQHLASTGSQSARDCVKTLSIHKFGR